jgi:hypothetical protein
MSDGVKVGDRVVVHGMSQKAIVEAVEIDSSDDFVLVLNWGEFGHSRVYGHDRGSVWQLFTSLN